jgi:hypothetical protein
MRLANGDRHGWLLATGLATVLGCTASEGTKADGGHGGAGGTSQVSTGGSTGTGGSASSGAGGTTGDGGSGGSTVTGAGGGDAGSTDDGAVTETAMEVAPPPVLLFGFPADVQGFALDPYPDTNDTNLTVVSDGGVAPTLTWSATEGDPDLGAVLVTAPYSDYKQKIDVRHTFGADSLQDWTGKTLRIRLKVASGFNTDSSFPGGVVFYVQTTSSWVWADAGWQNVESLYDGWQQFSFDLSAVTAAGWDAKQVIAFGIQINTGGGGDTAASKPAPATFYIDSVTAQAP